MSLRAGICAGGSRAGSARAEICAEARAQKCGLNLEQASIETSVNAAFQHSHVNSSQGGKFTCVRLVRKNSLTTFLHGSYEVAYKPSEPFLRRSLAGSFARENPRGTHAREYSRGRRLQARARESVLSLTSFHGLYKLLLLKLPMMLLLGFAF